MNKYLLYFLFRLSVAFALKVKISGLINSRTCRFIHSSDNNLKHSVSPPTTDDITRYSVASQFAYFKGSESSFNGSLNDLKNIYGNDVVYTPFFKDGTERETDMKRQILAGYIIQVSDVEIVVAFRGTKKKDWNEWKNNMDSIPVLRQFIKHSEKQSENDEEKHPVEFSLWIHRGINREYDRCRQDFFKKINELYKGGKIVFVGHSKGIVSQLGALDFVINYDSHNRCFPIHLITFGAHKMFADLPGGDNPHEIFKKYGLHSSRVHFLRDPVVNYPYFRNCYKHVFDTIIHLKQPPNSLLEHSIYNYKLFFMDVPQSKQ